MPTKDFAENKGILTEKQQAVWDLKQQGLTKVKIAETLGISKNMVTTHLKNAERRFREHERYLANEKKNSQIVDIELSRGELELIVQALSEYQRTLLKQAHYNVKTDWKGRLPLSAGLTQELSEKIQMKIYGMVHFKSIFGEGKEKE